MIHFISIYTLKEKQLIPVWYTRKAIEAIESKWHISHISYDDFGYYNSLRIPPLHSLDQVKYFYIRGKAIRAQLAKIDKDLGTKSIPKEMLLSIFNLENTITIQVDEYEQYEIEIKVL